jgi:hypothetical protein
LIKVVRPLLAATAVAATALIAGCTAANDAGSGSGGTTPAKPATVTTSAVPTTTSTATATSLTGLGAVKPWSTAPVTVAHRPKVPPVPTLTGIRQATHAEGYDRIVFDIPGALPGYTAAYVTKVRSDGSDRPVAVPGSHYLRIVLNPAQAHRDSGAPTVTGVHRVNLPVLKAYAITGDYEGHVTVVLGLNRKAGYRIAELDNRIYVDVQS